MGASARNGPVGHHALALRFPGHALLAVTAGTPQVGFLPQFAVNYNDDGSPSLFRGVTSSFTTSGSRNGQKQWPIRFDHGNDSNKF